VFFLGLKCLFIQLLSYSLSFENKGRKSERFWEDKEKARLSKWFEERKNKRDKREKENKFKE